MTGHGLTLQGLLKHVQLLIQLGELLSLSADFAHCVQHRGVVATAKQFANFRQAFLGQFFGQVHRNLARPSDAGRALFAVHVGDLDLVIIGDGFLYVFDADLSVLDRQQVA